MSLSNFLNGSSDMLCGLLAICTLSMLSNRSGGQHPAQQDVIRQVLWTRVQQREDNILFITLHRQHWLGDGGQEECSSHHSHYDHFHFFLRFGVCYLTQGFRSENLILLKSLFLGLLKKSRAWGSSERWVQSLVILEDSNLITTDYSAKNFRGYVISTKNSDKKIKSETIFSKVNCGNVGALLKFMT